MRADIEPEKNIMKRKRTKKRKEFKARYHEYYVKNKMIWGRITEYKNENKTT